LISRLPADGAGRPSTIDTDLQVPPERTHLMLDFKASWVDLRTEPRDERFARYPDESIAESSKWKRSRL